MSVDVVYGVQTSRKGGIFERVTGNGFYTLYNLLSDYKVPPNLTVARLMTRRYVAALVRHRDRSPFLGGLSVVTGFAQDSIPLRKTSKGSTAYSLARKLGLVLDSVTSFSRKPLIGIFYLGVAMLALATAVAIYLITSRLIFGNSVEGWVSLIVSVWWLGGLSIFCTGVVGIYVATLFVESKDRPYTVIRGIYAQGQCGLDCVLDSEHAMRSQPHPRTREPVR
jgi:putative glycosyltransferase